MSELDPLELARLVGNTAPFSTISEEEEDEDQDGFVGSRSRAFSLLAEALFALISRLWTATLFVSVLMYFLRKIPIHPVVHQSGVLISDRDVDIAVAQDYYISATPALFGKVLGPEIFGLVIPNIRTCPARHS
jgi:hypothetical protein